MEFRVQCSGKYQDKNVSGGEQLIVFYLHKLLDPPEISAAVLSGVGEHQRWRLSTSYRVLGIAAQLEASDCSLCVLGSSLNIWAVGG